MLENTSFSVFPLNNIVQGIIDRALCKSSVEIKHMVAAFVVMLISVVATSLCAVPDICKLRHCGGLPFVKLPQEIRVYRIAVAAHAVAVNFDRFGDQGFVACHQVRKVSQALRCVSLCSNVNVNVIKSFS